MKYGYVVIWTLPSGSQQVLRVDGAASLEEAKERAFYFAKVSGWTPPKWWQWWRWGDTRETEQEVKK